MDAVNICSGSHFDLSICPSAAYVAAFDYSLACDVTGKCRATYYAPDIV